MVEQEGGGQVAADVLAAVQSVLGTDEELVPLHEPEFRGHEADYVVDCIETGWVSSVGTYVTRFENDLAKLFGVERAIATSTGTAALHVCLILAGVQPGDEVLMPTLAFVATANAVSYAGGVPHFVDSEAASLGVCAAKLEAYLDEVAERVDGAARNRRSGRTIRALVTTHVFGHPSDLEALKRVADAWGLRLVEDAGESIGSLYRGEPTGGVGAVAALSFDGNMTVTTGGGGAILTNSAELGDRAKHLTGAARIPHRWGSVHDEVGFDYRLPNLNAALGCAQLERLDDMVGRKRELADRYRTAFAPIDGVAFLEEPKGTRSNYWLNAIVLSEELLERDPGIRDRLLGELNDAGYMVRPLWASMHTLPMYADCPRMELETAESLERRVLNLPSSARLAEGDVGLP